MNRVVRNSLIAAAVLMMMGCGPGTQSFPLDVAPADAQASFGALEACATRLGHQATTSKTSVQVKPTPSQRIEFVLGQDNAFTMMTWVETDGERRQLPKLKLLGEALWDCASKAPMNASSAATATPSAQPVAPPPTPTPTAPPPPPPPPTAAPTVEPAPAASSASPAGPKSCEDDENCGRPPGGFCDRNEDCGSGACSRGSCM